MRLKAAIRERWDEAYGVDASKADRWVQERQMEACRKLGKVGSRGMMKLGKA